MSENLPMKENNSFFGKIKAWFKNLFSGKPTISETSEVINETINEEIKTDVIEEASTTEEVETNVVEETVEASKVEDTEDRIAQEVETVEEKIEDKKASFEDSLKVDVKNDFLKDMKKEEWLAELEENPNLYYELPIDKLEIIADYYRESVNEYEQKLANIKKAS